MNTRAGQPARPEDLVDVEALLAAYTERVPDMSRPGERVQFGTSGHRGSSLDGSFNETHIVATTQAICDYRAQTGVTGPLFIGADTHALSAPALDSALEVLAGNAVRVFVDSREGFTPTPALSHAIIAYNREHGVPRADGIVVTPSHNPPRDGGFKYNPPHGGPADTEATSWIAERANSLIENGLVGVRRSSSRDLVTPHDFLGDYVEGLDSVINMSAIAEAKVRIGVDPLGGASVDYWVAIAERYQLDMTVVNDTVDPTWAFMTLDSDGKIRMDPSSPHAMATVTARRGDFDVLIGNDADADRHGIVTPDGGLMNPNQFLAVAIDYLYRHRPDWPSSAHVGKTLVSSSMIDRVVAALGRDLFETPVGFKWFEPGLTNGSLGFGGEESAGASFLKRDGSTWTTDKDGILLGLLAAEIIAVTGSSPSALYEELVRTHGRPFYARTDAPAKRAQRMRLAELDASDVVATELGGDPILRVLTHAPGNGAPLGGIKVETAHAWFAARPSGTEDVYKIYAESFRGSDHLAHVQAEARSLVDRVLEGA